MYGSETIQSDLIKAIEQINVHDHACLIYESAKKAGFKALRVTGEMTWALGNNIGVERLFEYEAKMNCLFAQNDVLAICQYNSTRFKPEMILNVIRTHQVFRSSYRSYHKSCLALGQCLYQNEIPHL